MWSIVFIADGLCVLNTTLQILCVLGCCKLNQCICGFSSLHHCHLPQIFYPSRVLAHSEGSWSLDCGFSGSACPPWQCLTFCWDTLISLDSHFLKVCSSSSGDPDPRAVTVPNHKCHQKRVTEVIKTSTGLLFPLRISKCRRNQK